ncbi:MAG TPA: ABC transporter ATP-binding protein [Acidimicrobiales bacterium]|nr:ABC transporter ATP-binding protein [Acidimicrobiales bacterium]
MAPLLTTDSLFAGYRGKAVVRGLSLTIEPGEVFALLGPNGAGKTTTLLTLAGMIPPVSGSVELFGEPLPRGKPHLVARKGLSFVPDDRGLFMTLTTRENLKLGIGKDGRPVDELLEFFPELEKRLKVPAGQLSGGEQQMLSLARALAPRPRLLLIDEMSMGLAPTLVERMFSVVQQLAADRTVAIVLVEQFVELALELATNAAVLVHGDVVLNGPASDLADRPDLLEGAYFGALPEELVGEGPAPAVAANGKAPSGS